MVGEDDAALDKARARVLDEVGPEALVDAVAVASNFERMVRIADSTGIPLDGGMDAVAADLCEDLDLGSFGSAANTPRVGGAKRLAGRLLRPVMTVGLRMVARRRARAR